MKSGRKECGSKEESKVTVTFAGETIVLHNCFIGGMIEDDDNAPIGLYSGVLDVTDMAISLMNMLRAVLKTTRQEIGMSVDKGEDFILHCLAEAVKRETIDSKEEAIAEFVNNYFRNHF